MPSNASWQGLFTDAICSAAAGELLYPYTYLQSPRTGVWRALGWPAAGTSVANLSALHNVPWHDGRGLRADHAAIKHASQRQGVPWRAPRPEAHLPPGGHPQRREWAPPRQHALLWTRLGPLDPLAQVRRRDGSEIPSRWRRDGSEIPPRWLRDSRPIRGASKLLPSSLLDAFSPSAPSALSP